MFPRALPYGAADHNFGFFISIVRSVIKDRVPHELKCPFSVFQRLYLETEISFQEWEGVAQVCIPVLLHKHV